MSAHTHIAAADDAGHPKHSHHHHHHHHHQHHHHQRGHHGGMLGTSLHATLHCLTGCVIGEVAGLAIGVTLGLPVLATIALATSLAYISGMTLGVVPVMRRESLGFLAALRIIWIGEVISIGVMELVMNLVDYHAGGMTAPSIFHWMFWQGLLLAVPAGFLAAWPVNYWLLRRNLKACH